MIDAYADDLYGITQEGRSIVIQGSTFRELFKALRELRKENM